MATRKRSTARPKPSRTEPAEYDPTAEAIINAVAQRVLTSISPIMEKALDAANTVNKARQADPNTPAHMGPGTMGAPNLNQASPRPAPPLAAAPQRVDFYAELEQLVPRVYEQWHQARSMLYDANSKLDEANPLQPDYSKLMAEAITSLQNYLSITAEVRRIYRIHG